MRAQRNFDSSSIEDSVQEVFIRLLKSADFQKIESGDALRGYVWRVARNVAYSFWQKHHSADRLKQELASATSDDQDNSHIVADDSLAAEQLMEIAEALLEPRDVTLLQLITTGHSIGEAAETLSLSYSAVGVRLHRLREKLRRAVSGGGRKN